MSESPVVVICQNESQRRAAAHLAERLHVPLLLAIDPVELTEPDYALVFAERVFLQQTGRKAPGPVLVDFLAGSLEHRRRFGGGKGQALAKACGLDKKKPLHILDLTAGLGRDGFVLASLGCEVRMLERSPLVHALLSDGLMHGQAQGTLEQQEILARMQLELADALEYLPQQPEDSVEVVYLDPMFPERQKSADVKKEMRSFQHLVGEDPDADELLEAALRVAYYRVVVKRSRRAPFLAARSPSYSLEGKSTRYDIYALRTLLGESAPLPKAQ